MSHAARNWSDLGPRIVTGIVLALIGAAGLWLGGGWFLWLLAVACAAMIWELALMLSPAQRNLALLLGALGGVSIVFDILHPDSGPGAVLALAIVPAIGALALLRGRWIMLAYGSTILVAGAAMYLIREDLGLAWMLWLVLIVVASDIAGYFVGRIVGGARFWPRVSPKKTWSGTVAGWIAAAVLGLWFAGPTELGRLAIPASVLLAFAAQMGDIAESAIKRKMAVKDSSDLLPGHGGVLDRFDGMIGAALALVAILALANRFLGLS